MGEPGAYDVRAKEPLWRWCLLLLPRLIVLFAIDIYDLIGNSVLNPSAPDRKRDSGAR